MPGKSHGWRSLVGCSPWDPEESDTTERLHFDFSLSCIGEGNGNPLQCSCLENPRDGGAWWGAVYGVAQSRTQLKRLSSRKQLLYFCIKCSDFQSAKAHYAKTSLLLSHTNVNILPCADVALNILCTIHSITVTIECLRYSCCCC